MKLHLMMHLLKDNLADKEWQAWYLMTCALVIFEDYIQSIDAKEFQRRFGEVGTEALSRYTRPS